MHSIELNYPLLNERLPILLAALVEQKVDLDYAKYLPVIDCSACIICEGVPSNTTWPPLLPPSGPISMIQSA